MSHKSLFSRALGLDPERLHFAAHSHHLWPDASFDAQVQAWVEANRFADRKWDLIFGEVVPEPDVPNLEKALALASEARPDLIVGFGGGSAMDVAKLVAVLTLGAQTVHEVVGPDKVLGPRLPLVQVPTTAGTGSEVGMRALVSDPATRNKLAVQSRLMLADLAIVDPALTMSVPASPTAAAGIDETRGDKIEVINVRFNHDTGIEGGLDGKSSLLDFSKNDIMRFVELGILTVVALLLIFFVLRPLLKTAAGGGANLPALAGANGVPVTTVATTVIGPDGQPQLVQLPAPSEMEQKIDIARIEGQVKASSVKKVADFVQSHPDDAAGILRTWVAEG